MSEIIDTVPGEEDSLELHVRLCEQRYKQLIGKFDVVEHRLDRLEGHVVDIKDSISVIGKNTSATYLKWAGTIIGVLLTLVIGLIYHLLK
jgi:tetrahydromethanopterin S-methyltransferase subunit B